MERASDLDDLLVKYQDVLDAFDAIGGDDYESRIMKQLNLADLGSKRDLRVSDLSGGEFKLVQAIREMLSKPDLLIMDEPDVFLDFANLNALKNLINGHKGILLVVTHNRYLLNHCFNKIIHLENQDMQVFEGSFSDYNLALLQGKIEMQELALADEEELKRNEVLLDKWRFRASELDSAALGRKIKARVRIQERLEARRIKTPFVEIKQPDIRFQTQALLEDETILTVSDYSLAFDEEVLKGVSFEIKAGDKVALIGANGTGKTSLLRALYARENESFAFHEDVQTAYLSQNQGEVLKESNTLMEEFFQAGFQSYDQIRAHLSAYGFEGEVLEQRIGDLSGGEKNILQLAKISAGSADLLLMDEPTSHLDTYAQIALERAIESYNGAILMISHDYYSIMNGMDYVLLIDDKTIRKMTMKKFRKMIHKHHFDRDELAGDQKKKVLETQIAYALKAKDFEGARNLSLDLEALIQGQ
jgi:ATP-binding cassette subfamily F protein 3